MSVCVSGCECGGRGEGSDLDAAPLWGDGRGDGEGLGTAFGCPNHIQDRLLTYLFISAAVSRYGLTSSRVVGRPRSTGSCP